MESRRPFQGRISSLFQRKRKNAEPSSPTFQQSDLEAISFQAYGLWRKGMWKELEELLHPALPTMRRSLGEVNFATLRSTFFLAQAFAEQVRWEEVEELLLPALPMIKKAVGDADSATLRSTVLLAQAFVQDCRWKEVEDLLIPALPKMRQVLGNADTVTLYSTYFLAASSLNQSRWRQVEELLLTTLPVMKKEFGQRNSATLRSTFFLAQAFAQQACWKEVEKLLLPALPKMRGALGELDSVTLRSTALLAQAFAQEDLWEEIEELLFPALPKIREGLGEANTVTLESIYFLSTALLSQGRWKEVEELLVPALPVMKNEDETHPVTLGSTFFLAEALSEQGQWEKVDELLRPALIIMKNSKDQGKADPITLRSTFLLAATFSRQDRWTEVEELLLPALPIMKNKDETDSATLGSTFLLAEALSRQGRWKDVEELLLPALPVVKKLDEEHWLALKSSEILEKAMLQQSLDRDSTGESRAKTCVPSRRKLHNKPDKKSIPENAIVPYLKSLFSHQNVELGFRISLQGLLSLPPSATQISESFIEFRGFHVGSITSPVVMTYEIEENERLIFRSSENNIYTEEKLLDLFQTSLIGLLKSAYVLVGSELEMKSCHWLAQDFDSRARRTIWSVIAEMDGVENIEVGRLDGKENRFAVVYRSPEEQSFSPLQSAILPWVEIRSSNLLGPEFKDETSDSRSEFAQQAQTTIFIHSVPSGEELSNELSPCSPPRPSFDPSNNPSLDPFTVPLPDPSKPPHIDYLLAGSSLRSHFAITASTSGNTTKYLYDPVTTPIGTLGCFMLKVQSIGEEIIYHGLCGLTTGHPIGNDTDKTYLITDGDAQRHTITHTVTIPEPFRRQNEMPNFMSGARWSKPCDEIALLEVPPHPQIKPEIENLDCLALDRTLSRYIKADNSQFSPAEIQPDTLWLAASQRPSLVVYKYGAATGLTQGYLTGLSHSRPKYKRSEGVRLTPKDTEYPFWGIVEWVDARSPFSREGDSGAMVYVKSKEDKVTPIGIHCGTVDDKSYFMILSIAVEVVEQVMKEHLGIDLELRFLDKSRDIGKLGESLIHDEDKGL